MGNDDIQVFSNVAFLKIIDVACPNLLIAIMKWIAEGNKGLVYLRIPRAASKVIHPDNIEFEYEKGFVLKEDAQDKAVIVSSGREIYLKP